MLDRIWQRFLLLSSARMSNWPRPIFLPIRLERGKVVFMGPSMVETRSKSSKLVCWDRMRVLRRLMACTIWSAGVRDRSCSFTLAAPTGVTSRKTLSSFRTSVFTSFPLGSSSDWEPPSLRVDNLRWRSNRERLFSLLSHGGTISWKDPSSMEESWDLSRPRELKPLSSEAEPSSLDIGVFEGVLRTLKHSLRFAARQLIGVWKFSFSKGAKLPPWGVSGNPETSSPDMMLSLRSGSERERPSGSTGLVTSPFLPSRVDVMAWENKSRRFLQDKTMASFFKVL